MGPAIAFALLLGGEEPGDVVVNPDWVKKPSGDDIARFYPAGPMWLGVEGVAVIECTVALDGQPKDCLIVSETPPEYGFGDAAIKSSTVFRFSPKTVNGQPTDDGRVRFTIRYNMAVSEDRVKTAARCAGWAQGALERANPAPTRLKWAATYWRFAYVASATRMGEKPSVIAARLEETRKTIGPRIVRAAEQYRDCWSEAYAYLPAGFTKKVGE